MSDTKIPYNAEMRVVEKLLGEIPSIGSEGLNIQTLYKNIGEANNTNKSFSLTFVRFLGIADSDRAKVWATEFGRKLAHIPADRRKRFLAKNVPPTYMTILKWILYSNNNEMGVIELKEKFVETYGSGITPVILDRGMTTFLNYVQYLGLIKYIVQGRASKAVLTEDGKNLLQNIGDIADTNMPATTASTQPQETELPTSGKYPIKIIAPDRTPITIEIHTEADWTAISSIIYALHESWKKKEAENK